MKSIKEGNFKKKKVLVRCDFNVPVENGKILDDFRIRKALPTLKFLLEKGAKIILISHFGRPKGKVVEELRLNLIAERLEKIIGKEVLKINECIGEKAKKSVDSLKEGQILMLENVRFYPGEEKNDINFAQSLAKLGEIFVNEAFSVCHRKHASVFLLPKFLPSFAGFLLEEEVKNLENFMNNFEKPLVSLLGGKKIKDKAPLIKKFSEIGDFVLVNHLIWDEMKKEGFEKKENILAPVDGIDGNLDIGPKTLKIFKEKISIAKTIFWNGPFGRIEEEKYSKGTKEIALAILESKAFSLIGGGETIEFTNKLKITEKFTFASTGGGAMLKFLAGEKLPGLEALSYYGD